MSASVSFACDFCKKFKSCKNKPENNLKHVNKRGDNCFQSQKIADQLKDAVWGNKKKGKRKKLNKPVEEEENKDGNV